MGQEVGAGERGPEAGREAPGGQAAELQAGGWPGYLSGVGDRTPLFSAQHSERYLRQALIREYMSRNGVNLIVLIDQLFDEGLTLLEELLFDCTPDKPLHVLLASPGGSTDTALRMVRSMQLRCTELTVIVPDLAKSAATLLCLGAHRILMGPAGDLGPIDPQFQVGGRSLASAKEIVAAVDEAEDRVVANPESFPLFSSLLSDVNMLMLEQAKSAIEATTVEMTEALSCCSGRSAKQIKKLAATLEGPLISDPKMHSQVVSADRAKALGLPVEELAPDDQNWQIIWSLWTRYFTLGCFPVGEVAVYEGRRSSAIKAPPGE